MCLYRCGHKSRSNYIHQCLWNHNKHIHHKQRCKPKTLKYWLHFVSHFQSSKMISLHYSHSNIIRYLWHTNTLTSQQVVSELKSTGTSTLVTSLCIDTDMTAASLVSSLTFINIYEYIVTIPLCHLLNATSNTTCNERCDRHVVVYNEDFITTSKLGIFANFKAKKFSSLWNFSDEGK